jgi:hypothetical protein
MPKPKVTSILWTERSLQNAISIKEYLISNFSTKEVDHFYAVLQSMICWSSSKGKGYIEDNQIKNQLIGWFFYNLSLFL